MRDTVSNVQIKRAHSPYYYSADTVFQCQEIDLQGYDSCYFAIATGDLADANATFAVLLQESDTAGSGFTDVADGDMVSQTYGTAPETAAAFQFDDDNEVRKIGYIGSKRYLRLYITPSGNTGTALVSVTAHLTKPSRVPVSQAAS